jgi:hypothetical protein
MPVYVKDSSTWYPSKQIYVKNSGAWVEPQEVYIRDSGSWKLLHKVVTISSNTNNLNLFSYIGSPSIPLTLRVNINSGVVIGSTSSSTPSLESGSFPTGSQIIIVNAGTIKGAGGAGGTGANYGGSATAGSAGGTALSISAISQGNIIIDNSTGFIYGGGGGGGGGGYFSTSSTCFPAGTLINTPNGLVAIETLNSGDLVYGFDIYADPGAYNYAAKLVAKPVTQVFKHSWSEADEFSRLLIIDHQQGTLTITGNHEVLTSSRDATGPYPHFVRAEHLQIGDIIYDDNGSPTEILEITPGEPYDYVYNFEVADVHTYVASGIRVHNGGGGGGGKGTSYYYYGGGGGGGGAGVNGGAAGSGGTGANGNGSNGTAGSSTGTAAGGNGGAGTATGQGGSGGGLGSTGSAGSDTNAAAGGAAGYYIVGNSYVTWTAIGTVAGQTA